MSLIVGFDCIIAFIVTITACRRRRTTTKNSCCFGRFLLTINVIIAAINAIIVEIETILPTKLFHSLHMKLEMTFHIRFGCESSIAFQLMAFKRSFATMNSKMRFQIRSAIAYLNSLFPTLILETYLSVNALLQFSQLHKNIVPL